MIICSDLFKLGLLNQWVILFYEVSSESSVIVLTSVVFRHSVFVAESEITLALDTKKIDFLLAIPAARVIFLLRLSGFFNRRDNLRYSLFDHFFDDGRLLSRS